MFDEIITFAEFTEQLNKLTDSVWECLKIAIAEESLENPISDNPRVKQALANLEGFKKLYADHYDVFCNQPEEY